MGYKSIVTIFVIFVLNLFFVFILSTMPQVTEAATTTTSGACPDPLAATNEKWGMPGGFSSPSQPNEEDYTRLRKVWGELFSKCAELPEDVNKITICSVQKQVVAGMNYKYTLVDGEGKTFKTVIYVPLPQQGQQMGDQEFAGRVMLCEATGVVATSGEASA
jgi:hypothetical protein